MICNHKWRNSYDHLGLVGSLYRYIYTSIGIVEGCGALRDSEGNVLLKGQS